MRRIIVCAVLAGGLLVAGASPALAAPRGMGIGGEGAISGLLGDLVQWVQARLLPSGIATKNGPEMDPNGRAATPPGDRLNDGWEMDPHGIRATMPVDLPNFGPEMDPDGLAATPPGDVPNNGWEMDPNG